MATQESIAKAVAKGADFDGQPTVSELLDRKDIKKRFLEVLGDKAPGFVTSVISATKGNKYLMACEPMSVIASAMIAATLDLPVNGSLGFAHIVPYKDKAQFQLGYKGFIQLGIRTGQYRTMNASEVYEDEIKSWNPITGEIEFTPQSEWKQRYDGNGKIVGYVAFFRTLNGFEKFLYMTTAQVEAHARKYSQSYGYDIREGKRSSKWSTDFQAMAIKTVLKLLLSKYGLLSVQMQKALKVDQAVVNIEGEPEYIDAIPADEFNQVPAGDAQEPA